ncbi:MFS transporter [Zafaria sp. Z1313]|uniref:MFS transporter n=1 Tax=Zafaria sp. Z1313 TaxID=3423202 RepID=UPI003D302E3F
MATGRRLRENPAFVRFWAAAAASDAGTYLTTVALSVLVLEVLGGSAQDQGLVGAFRWAPYLLFGLVAGLWVDRWRRRTVLIAADVGRAVVLGALCLTGLAGPAGALPAVFGLVFAFGVLALLADAAHQSFLPQIVPRPLLVRANMRLQQSDTVAQTSGGVVAGTLVTWLGAPFALLLDAASHLLSAAVLSTLRDGGRGRPEGPAVPVRTRIAQGLRWIYRHPRLAPLAWCTHGWFIGSAMIGTVLPVLVLQELSLGALGLGLVMSCAGIGAVVGTSLAPLAGARFGTGRALVLPRLAEVPAVALIAAAPWMAGGQEAGVPWAAGVAVGLGQLVFGFSMGVGGPLEMGYWQAVTPDRLIARMSATRRSANRGMIVLGAPLGGFLAVAWSPAAALWTAAAVLLAAAAALWSSPFRDADVDADQAGPGS